MKKYDNFFVPVDDIEMAKKYYENNLGLKVKFDFSDMGMIAFNVDGEEAAIILKDTKKFKDMKQTIWNIIAYRDFPEALKPHLHRKLFTDIPQKI